MPSLTIIEWAAVGLLVIWLATQTLPGTRRYLTSIWEFVAQLVSPVRDDEQSSPPAPDAGQVTLREAVDSIELLIGFFEKQENEAGEAAARQCGVELFREGAPDEPK